MKMFSESFLAIMIYVALGLLQAMLLFLVIVFVKEARAKRLWK